MASFEEIMDSACIGIQSLASTSRVSLWSFHNGLEASVTKWSVSARTNEREAQHGESLGWQDSIGRGASIADRFG